MAWRRPGNKPLSETVMVSLLTHICVTRPQWVNRVWMLCLLHLLLLHLLHLSYRTLKRVHLPCLAFWYNFIQITNCLSGCWSWFKNLHIKFCSITISFFVVAQKRESLKYSYRYMIINSMCMHIYDEESCVETAVTCIIIYNHICYINTLIHNDKLWVITV